MVKTYWIMEFMKVLAGYIFLMYIWPSVTLHKYLKGRSLTFRFGFCSVFQPLLLSVLIQLLGTCHILNAWVLRALLYIPFLAGLFLWIGGGEEKRRSLRRLVNGTYKAKHFFKNVGWRFFDKIVDFCRMAWKYSAGRRLEYGLLLVILIYGVIYFSYGAFQDYSYGFGDMYTHSSWIYSISEGELYPQGFYPEGMHRFIYGINVMCGVRVYSCLLFLGGIHVTALLLAAWLFLKEIFRWRFTPLFVLTAFLTLDVTSTYEIVGMARLQWTLPQEFGLYTAFLCPAFLIRYLRSTEHAVIRGKETSKCWNGELLVLVLAIAASLSIHFYPIIMAFVLCLCIVPVMLRSLFSKERILPLASVILAGAFAGAVPVGLAILLGKGFQNSFQWGMKVLTGREWTDNSPAGAWVWEVIEDASLSDNFLGKIYHAGYEALYGPGRAKCILIFTVIGFLVWLFLQVRPLLLVKGKSGQEKWERKNFGGYLTVILSSVIFMIMYCSRGLGWPVLVEGPRLCSVERILLLAMICIVPDVIFVGLNGILRENNLKAVSAALPAVFYLLLTATGMLHGFLYYELTRYNEAVLCTYSITEKMPKNSYTIVSPTDEHYQAAEYGWHEELIRLVNEGQTQDYTIPTEYVFLFVEKKPIEYAQFHFFTGPGWLAKEKYGERFESAGYKAVQAPEIAASQIKEMDLSGDIPELEYGFKTYTDLEMRTQVESWAYAWCQEFDKLYPGALKTYFENENFVCYYFKQRLGSYEEAGNLYPLGVLIPQGEREQ